MLKRWKAWPRDSRWLAGGIATVLLVFVAAWVLFVPVADWLSHHDVGSATGTLHETALDNARGRLLTLGAGVFAAGALAFTALNFNLLRRNSQQADQWQRQANQWQQRTYELTEQGQVTDRYTRAIEQLGSKELDVRIGGIYALERIARDSVRDHQVVMEVLAAFIRGHSVEQWPPPEIRRPWTRPDVQAALAVVGRRDAQRDTRPLDLMSADLAYAVLEDADLAGANLTGVNFSEAKLTGVNFSGAILSTSILEGAHLPGARMAGVIIDKANFARADLWGADLTRAQLTASDLTGAQLTRAKLTGANLSGSDLSRANLTDADLAGAVLVAYPGDVLVRHANLTTVEFPVTDLTGAQLTRAKLTGANLEEADLSEADLTNADLTDIGLTRANLTDARWPEGTPVPKGWTLARVSDDHGS